jgi:hypothetical protein
MAFLQEELRNFSTKGWLGILGSGDRISAPDNLSWFEEASSIDSIIKPNNVWVDYNSILPAPTISIAQTNASNNPTVIKDYTGLNQAIKLTPSPNNKLFYTTATFNDLSTRLYNWIMPQLIPRTDAGFIGFPSIGYMIKIYNGDPDNGGTEITTSAEQQESTVGWWFNFGSGALKVASSFSSITDVNDVWLKGFQYIGSNINDLGNNHDHTASDISTNETGISVQDKLDELDNKTSNNQTITLNCDNTATVSDIVYNDTSISNKVIVHTNNTLNVTTLGIIIEKPTSTTAVILILGNCLETYSGLNLSKKVWLSNTGSLTTVRPTSGYLQEIGICLDLNKVFVNINHMKIKLA